MSRMKLLPRRWLFLFCCSGWLVAAPAGAQEWAQKMFLGELKHNFGTVARAATTEHRFELQNIYRDDIHIAGIRTSCGCTTPTVERDTLKSWEKGSILAHFNTDRFSGQRGATLTVIIDRPQPAEVQLRVDGYIRTDIAVNPGGVNFGAVTQGAEMQQTVTVDYQGGQADWQVLRIKNTNPNLEAKLIVPTANTSRRSYQVFVRLKDGAPAGYLHDAVTLVTNDPSSPELPIVVEARVTAALQVSPASLLLGAIPSGQKVTKQLALKAQKPFRIVSIECDLADGFELPSPASLGGGEAKTWQMVPVVFVGGEAGQRSCTLRITTDLPNAAPLLVPVTVDVQGLVTK